MRDGVSIVYSIVCSGADQRKHQNPASLAFLRGIHLWSVNTPHKWPVTRKMFPFDNVIMKAVSIFYGIHCRSNLRWAIYLSNVDLNLHFGPFWIVHEMWCMRWSWWKGHIFGLLALCAGNQEFAAQRSSNGRFKWNFRLAIFKLNLVIGGCGISCEIVPWWMQLDLTYDKSTLG